MRVLIVEDEVRLASTLQDRLELNGYTADVSHDGESGLDNALSGIYDVVLLDVMLPKQDGFTVLTAYQGEEGTSWRGDGANITDAPVVRALLEDFAALTITKCVDYHPSDDAAALCGFDNPAAKVSIRYTTETDAEQTLQLTIGSRLPDETGRYVQLGDDSTIYFLPTELLDPLMRVSVTGLEG